ncbi:GDSL esterase/lipase-like protein [Drosera capensis]
MASKIPTVAVLVIVATLCCVLADGLTIEEARNLTAQKKMTGFIVIGDSTVDTGNNNYYPLYSVLEANFPPYGENFYNRTATGRFCDGQLAPDYLTKYFNLGEYVPAILLLNSEKIVYSQPNASYASAGTGFDNCTAVNVWPFPDELVWFNKYVQDLSALVGNETAKETINNAVCLFSMGTNDWIRNYFIPENICGRALQYTVDQYADFLVRVFNQSLEVLYKGGCRRFIVYSVPATGCMPTVKAVAGNFSGKCVDRFNNAAVIHNTKIQQALLGFNQTHDVKTAYVSFYELLLDAVYNSSKYGFTESSIPCCGMLLSPRAILCNPLLPTCPDASKNVFWDSVHPTQAFYEILANKTMDALTYGFFS